MLRFALLTICLALAAGCGSDGSPAPIHVLTPGEAFHGAMTPAAPVQVVGDAGPQAITAIADPGFVFAGWVATPAGNAMFGNAAQAATTVTLSGSAAIAPTFMVAAADFFVNPRLGADDAAGTTAAQPFKTLTHALAVAGGPVGSGDPAKAAGLVVALAPGLYDAANGETFPIIITAGLTVVGDEENYGVGTVVSGSGPMPGWTDIPVGLVPSSYATVAGLHVSSAGRFTMAYDVPSGGTSITLRRNTIAAGSDGGLYVQVASQGLIADNIWLAGPSMTLVAVGGEGNTPVQGNIFHGPVELDDNHLDLGGGAGLSTGHNQFIGDGMCFFEGAGIMAQGNHWKHAPPTVSAEWLPGPSDYDMHLRPGASVDTQGYY